jgi:transketolase
MRKQLCDALVARSVRPEMVFLTGDLGFMALEPLQQALGPRFINAGVSEQNMISVAAAMSREGMDSWIYSIAPFCYARPFEQIRNDIAFHALPVRLIGNGGGYGYGVMGPTHHAIEDYGVLLTLPNMRVFIPVFDEDVPEAVVRAGGVNGASYLRLGRGEPPKGFAIPAYKPWRQLIDGDGPVVIAVGPLAGIYIEPLLSLPQNTRPKLWAVAELPLKDNAIPKLLIEQIAATQQMCIAEEHVARGGFASEMVLYLAMRGIVPKRVVHLHALAHHYERYGSQAYLRCQSKLDPDSMLAILNVLSKP